MSVQEWTFLMVGISFAVYILIAFKSRAQSTSDFYVAGKGVNPIVNGMALPLTGCRQLHSYPWQD